MTLCDRPALCGPCDSFLLLFMLHADPLSWVWAVHLFAYLRTLNMTQWWRVYDCNGFMIVCHFVLMLFLLVSLALVVCQEQVGFLDNFVWQGIMGEPWREMLSKWRGGVLPSFHPDLTHDLPLLSLELRTTNRSSQKMTKENSFCIQWTILPITAFLCLNSRQISAPCTVGSF